jgi:uncharacterized protein (DUF1778 family)
MSSGPRAGAWGGLLYTVCMTETKDIRLDMRVSRTEKELFQRAAEQDGRPLSNWIRDRLLRAAKTELGDEGTKGKSKRPSP